MLSKDDVQTANRAFNVTDFLTAASTTDDIVVTSNRNSAGGDTVTFTYDNSYANGATPGSFTVVAFFQTP
jgi:hypothetical protein